MGDFVDGAPVLAFVGLCWPFLAFGALLQHFWRPLAAMLGLSGGGGGGVD